MLFVISGIHRFELESVLGLMLLEEKRVVRGWFSKSGYEFG